LKKISVCKIKTLVAVAKRYPQIRQNSLYQNYAQNRNVTTFQMDVVKGARSGQVCHRRRYQLLCYRFQVVVSIFLFQLFQTLRLPYLQTNPTHNVTCNKPAGEFQFIAHQGNRHPLDKMTSSLAGPES